MIPTSEFQAAGLTAKASVLNTSSGNEVYVALDSTGRAVLVGRRSVLDDKTSGIWQTGFITDTYVEGVGYRKSAPPYTFTNGTLAGWYADTLTPAQLLILDRANVSGAVAAGAAAQAANCAGFKITADAAIDQARRVYGRGPSVPEDRIIIGPGTTLAGYVYAEMAKANRDAMAAGCTQPFPQAYGAHTAASLNFPPPDGTIFLGSGDAPLGVSLASATTPTSNEGPWPAGSHSAFTAPANAWRAGQSPPPPFRFPSPQLWYGPNTTPAGVTLSPTPPTPTTGGGYPGVAGPIPPGPSSESGDGGASTVFVPPKFHAGGGDVAVLLNGQDAVTTSTPAPIAPATVPTPDGSASPGGGDVFRNPAVWVALAIGAALLLRRG